MDFLVTLMQLFIYIVPFIVLYFVIAAAVKKRTGLLGSRKGNFREISCRENER